jgi:hypothetical protein
MRGGWRSATERENRKLRRNERRRMGEGSVDTRSGGRARREQGSLRSGRKGGGGGGQGQRARMGKTGVPQRR